MRRADDGYDGGIASACFRPTQAMVMVETVWEDKRLG